MCRISNEVILIDDVGRLYEGLSSNFAVLDVDNRLITAPSSAVLSGTIMEVVKVVAGDMGIVVVEEFPLVSRLCTYKAAFVTSTSRLVLPIHLLTLDNGQEISFHYEPNDKDAIINILRKSVEQKLIDRAEYITV